ncbi:hypothetical protein DM01DRAFT_1335515 [Hesseltinella vesiculosa]|uniref:Rap-GAP domain-containing protein n=1 Tax=Hesseltinella vesiculosa TaxID=101127 RepID=A0A1X2GHZ1_9FUNG|nr:hypothetical protein DM01DRAFT_1335515 [Hesseltinella vesiculosa]
MMPRDCRHAVFDFMLACISGQYQELGMARITFYNFLRNYTLVEDFADMYKVLSALCNGGRDISGFEKSINKLLITWLDMTLRRVSYYPHRLLLASLPSTSPITSFPFSWAIATVPSLAAAASTVQQDHVSVQVHPQPSPSSTTNTLTTTATTAATTATASSTVLGTTSATNPSQATPSSIPFLSDILHLLTMIAKFNFALFEEKEVTQMVMATQQAFYTSNHPGDIATCLSFCDVLVRYRFVPLEALEPFLQIICGSVTLPQQALTASKVSYWSIFLNLLRSHCAHNAILTLCNFLDDHLLPGSSAENLAEGATVLLSRVAWGDNHKQLKLSDSYKISNIVILLYFLRAAQQGAKDNAVIQACLLHSLISLIAKPHDKAPIGLMDWEVIWDICEAATTLAVANMSDAQRAVLQSQLAGGSPPEHLAIEGRYDLHHQLGHFLFKIQQEYGAGDMCLVSRWMDLLYTLRHDLPTPMAMLLLDYYQAEHLLLPSSDQWLELLWEMVCSFYQPPTASTALRSRVLMIVSVVYVAIKDFYMDAYVTRIVLPMMKDIPQETDMTLKQAAIDLLVQCACDCQSPSLFGTLLPLLQACARCQCQRSSHPKDTNAAIASFGSISASSSPVNHGQCSSIAGICGLLDLFQQLLHNDQHQPKHFCVSTYHSILSLVQEPHGLFCPYGGPRLMALDFLLRLRCSSNHRLYLIDKVPLDDDDQYVAKIRELYGKHKIDLQRQQEEAYPAMISRPAPAKPYYGYASPLFLSYNPQARTNDDSDLDDDDDAGANEADPSDQDGGDQDDPVVLDMNALLQTYVTVFTECPNWHVVVFLLQRFNWQLATKHLFCGARKGIRQLSRLLVKGVTSRQFLKQVTHVAPAIKRNDFSIHAYQVLTVLVSYRYLNKRDQDEIVYAFYVGITQVTAATKTCIHALSLCCHELPLSIAKMLNEILRRMSQIISVGGVAVHILEFLSGLARLPSLYANFTGDMYKPVFAIALNYLQHARSATASAGSPSGNSATANTTAAPTAITNTSTTASPAMSPLFNTSASLNQSPAALSETSSPHATTSTAGSPATNKDQPMSQYVLTMAYLVITIWFTAIPLRERRKHVPFIVQRLLAGGQADEPTFTCVDMLSRFTFADVSLSPNKSLVANILMEGDSSHPPPAPPPNNTPSLDGHQQTQAARTWVYGHTLFTLKTAKALGWVEVTIRRPSGTVSMMCNIENTFKSDNVDYKTLPALLMMQYQPDLMSQRLLQDDNLALDSCQEEVGQPTSASWMDQGAALGITLREEPAAAQEPAAAGSASTSPQASACQPADDPADTFKKKKRTTSGPSSSASSPSILPPGLKTPRLGKTKETLAQEERVKAILRDILADPDGHPQTQTADDLSKRTVLRKTEPPLDPAFLYMQMVNYPDMAMENLPPLPEDDATVRAIGNLDRIPVVDFHKIGVLYVAKGQTEETAILANEHGSPDYVKFLHGLGTLERLRGRQGNTGGLDRSQDVDGAYAYFWKDDVTEMVFHTATMMPTRLDRDPRCSGKKRHIGNDFVTIVYVDDLATPFRFDTLPGQFNFINIIIRPYSKGNSSAKPLINPWLQENSFFLVTLQKRPDMPADIGPLGEGKLISAQSLPGFIRQVSLHANIFAQIFHHFGAGGKQEYVSHWRERLRHIRRIKDRWIQQSQATSAASASTSTANNSTTPTNSANATPVSNANVAPTSAPPQSILAATSMVHTNNSSNISSTNVTTSPKLDHILNFTRYT